MPTKLNKLLLFELYYMPNNGVFHIIKH